MTVQAVRTVSEWPLVLCGPMLRRVTPRSVTVFVALREPRQVTLRVFDSPSPNVSPNTSPSALRAEASAVTLPLGQRLHVLALAAEPEASSVLEPGRVFGYDLVFTDDAGHTESLASLGLLTGDWPLGYEAGHLPGFSLPADLARTHLVHGSCRKPHAPGRDALPILDGWLAAEHDQPHARPHGLVLTGDQIYADDVAVCLMRTIVATVPALLGWPQPETIAAADPSTFYTSDHADLRPGIPRGTTVLRETQVTSTEVDGHLVFLGEFYAMYLLNWCDALWPRDAAGHASLPLADEVLDRETAVPEPFGYIGEQPAINRVHRIRQNSHARVTTLRHARSTRAAALEFADALPRVRRALANVPTLMIFDDHDVTDDWNLHREWVLAVRGSRMGRHLVRNALLAYAVFQDWGNRPEAYAPGTTGAALFDAIRVTPSAQGAALDGATFARLGLPATGDPNLHEPDRMTWHYQVDLDPLPLRIAVLDTRTWRHYPLHPPQAAPGLLGTAALAEQAPLPPSTSQVLQIVVAAAPVLGLPFWEEYLQRILVARGGSAQYDNEVWSAHRATFEELLAHLAGFGRTVLLSGDVHFGYTCDLAWFGGPPGAATATGRIVQLCSSALKNEDLAHRAMGRLGHRPSDGDGPMEIGWIGWTFPPAGLANLRQTFYEDLMELPGYRPVRTAAWESWLRTVIDDRLQPPVVLPTSGWPGQESRDLLATMAPHAEWAYRVRYLRDARGDLPINREVIGHNNIGRLRFDVGSAGQPSHVVHRLYRWHGGDTAWTEHTAALAQPSVTERPAFT